MLFARFLPSMPVNELDPIENGHNRITDTRYGRILHHSHDQPLAQLLQSYGEYSEQQVGLYTQICQPGATIIEVGAHVGEFTLPLAKLVGASGRVFAFEAEQHLFINLCGTLALNSVSNTEPFHAVVSDETGTTNLPQINVMLEQPQNMGSYGHRLWDNASDEDPSNISTAVVTLDTALGDLETLQFIKISVNGMEARVIQGARELIGRLRPTMALANDLLPERGLDASKALIETLWQLDYTLYWNLSSLFNQSNYRNNPQPIQHPSLTQILALPSELQSQISGMEQITDAGTHPLNGQ